MQIEQVIGTRIATAREQSGITQGELGKRVGEWLGQDWTRQAIWAAEKGKRSFTAAELITFSYALNVAPDFLLTPPVEVREVHLPSGAVISRHEFNNHTLPSKESSEVFQDMETTLSDLHERAQQMIDDIGTLAINVAEARALAEHTD